MRDIFEGLFVAPRLRVERASSVAEGSPPPADERSALLPPNVQAGEARRDATFTENFFDLMYVLPMQNLFSLSPGRSPRSLLLFVVYFATIFNSWLGEAFYNTRFDTDDVPARGITVLQMVCIAGMASGVNERAEYTGDSTFALSYAALRALLVMKYARVAWHLPKLRPLTLGFITGFSVALGCWVASAFVAPAFQLPMALLGLCVDYTTPFVLALVPRFKMVPVHHQHMPERFAGFTCLVLAGSLFSVQMQMPPLGAVDGWALPPIFISMASVALPLAFLSLYAAGVGLPSAELAGFRINQVGAKVRVYMYLYLHMPLALAIMLSSNGLYQATGAAFAAAGSGPGAAVTRSRSLPPLDTASRWLICAGWALATATMGVVHALGGVQDHGTGLTHRSTRMHGYGGVQITAEEVAARARTRTRRTKLRRLWLRLAAAVLLLLLPIWLRDASLIVYMSCITVVHLVQVLVVTFRKRHFQAKAVRLQRRASALVVGSSNSAMGREAEDG